MLCSLEYWAMDKVQKPSNPACYTPSSGPFRTTYHSRYPYYVLIASKQICQYFQLLKHVGISERFLQWNSYFSGYDLCPFYLVYHLKHVLELAISYTYKLCVMVHSDHLYMLTQAGWNTVKFIFLPLISGQTQNQAPMPCSWEHWKTLKWSIPMTTLCTVLTQI
jgi:hypothetical protein